MHICASVTWSTIISTSALGKHYLWCISETALYHEKTSLAFNLTSTRRLQLRPVHFSFEGTNLPGLYLSNSIPKVVSYVTK